MRTSLYLIAALGLMLVAAAASGVGCGSLPADCPDRYRCPDTGGTGGNGTGGAGGGGGGAGGGGGPVVACIPSENKDPVADSCGVFVSSSKGQDGAGRGAKGAPWKTLGAAVKAAVAQKKPLYACAETFTEELTVGDGVTVFGGLDCKAGWAYIGAAKKTALTADPDKTPLTLSTGTEGTELYDLEIRAASALSQDKAGGSSIAVIANQATASFVRCDIIAGDAMSGLPGETPENSEWPKLASAFEIVGNDGLPACLSGSTTMGGSAKLNMFCVGDSVGGTGGVGSLNTGGNGEAIPANPQTAVGGLGEPAADPTWSCAVGQGALGAKGMGGMAGEGARGPTSLGIIGAKGYVGVNGLSGGDGGPGQGGGGGGGAKGKAASNCYGASGGGGGVGGCGGKGGLGGYAGGASFGILDLDAALKFEKVTIKVGKGGNGGDGGEGEFGGVGGNGGSGGVGMGTNAACNGGNGGNGGQGGKGGGARGGHAVGIAYTMAKPDLKEVTFTPGIPGVGGLGQDMAHSGDDGIGADTQAF